MKILERFQSALVILAVLIGLALGQLSGVGSLAGRLVVPFLISMLVVVFLHTPLSGLADAFRNLRFTSASQIVNFLWTPIFGWLLGLVFLPDQPELRIGLIMLIVTPCTDWYLVFTQLANGNVRIAASLLPLHLLLQLSLLPVYLWIFAGGVVPIDVGVLIESVVLVLFLPLGIATLIRQSLLKVCGSVWFETKLLQSVAPLQTIFLLLAIVAMFASQGGALLSEAGTVLRLLPPLLVFYAGTLSIGLWVSRQLRFSYGECTAFCFATLAKNSPVSLAIAVVAFPDQPLIALALVVEPLIELPVMAVLPQFFRRFIQPRWGESS